MIYCDCGAEDKTVIDKTEDRNKLGQFMGMWENMGMTCLTGLEIPHNGILAYLIKVSIYLVSDH
jgi:hypothetical protein